MAWGQLGGHVGVTNMGTNIIGVWGVTNMGATITGTTVGDAWGRVTWV